MVRRKRSSQKKNRRNEPIDDAGDNHKNTDKNGDDYQQEYKRYYLDPAESGSYRGVEAFYRRLRELNIPGVTRERVKQFLQSQNPYTLHRQAQRHFKRVRIYAHKVDQQWQADLAEMQDLADANDGVRYILTVVDTLSKFAFAEPVKGKFARNVRDAFKRVLERSSPRVPERLQTDKGAEFHNTEFRALCKSHKINHFSSNSDQKAAGVERFNRTLKRLLFAYMRNRGTKRWLDVLQPFIDSYNNTQHSRTKMTPNEAYEIRDNPEQVAALYYRLYGAEDANRKAPRVQKGDLRVGQMVRISHLKGVFDKGYKGDWTMEHFAISEVVKRYPRTVYKLVDHQQRPIHGLFYREELQPIGANRYIIEEILRERKGPRGRAECFVKWLGWGPEYNSWIPKTDLQRLDEDDEPAKP